ncbi:hypothetical protein MSLAZ_1354 [Methanosarcina lacustris Z-7289]|uniref:ATPase-like protein n=1 Tax=Methanosarcina lacustris Z-7289 TaxID=1434111 RepID=A0A0E3WSM6_9EURY|nr:BREX system P-loop protein BrxC [Methanosarcina lacustris]AKB74615.1 hypothetical protein MSLAZ_1354 [Methanosarcina lacustris Z-7289]
MTAEIKIEDLFEKDIRRDVNGVIKVDQGDEKSVYTELDEYVVTKEVRKRFDDFFRNYTVAMEEPTDKTGVWVSGFFGSGKSHFLKILSYLLENRTIQGKTALDFFRTKIDDPAIFSNIEKAVTTGSKDVILFNIDSKANTVTRGDEQIVNIFMRVFNEMRGYQGDVFWIAELEEDLEEKGLYEVFKSEFERIKGKSWENRRDTYIFEQDPIIEALESCGYMSRDAAVRLIENDGANYTLSVEKFAKKLEKYCKSKGEGHQVIFLVDEIGQYIGENSELMLNLQTIVEELGTKLQGKAWVVVTSQADIDTVTKEHVKGYDFSKIQGRFNTRLNLSSANVDEVIKKRILSKKEEYRDVLASYYTEKQTILRNLLSFSNKTEMKVYKGEEDFFSVYPFVPYQFNLVQKVFERIRRTGFTGKHLAQGERSMLSAFKDSTVNQCEGKIGLLIPFHVFYKTIEGFLDPIIAKTINQAIDNDQLDDEDCELLKILFMIRNIEEIEPNLDNLTVLSISSVDENKIKLRQRISKSLRKLEDQTLISKSEDRYYFLTNEEQEINKEIKRMDVENHQILDEVYETLYSAKESICPQAHKVYKFNKALDDRNKTSPNTDLTIKFLTPLSEEYFGKGSQQSLDGYSLSNIDSADTLLFVFPESDFIDKIRFYLKIEKYLKQNNTNRNNPEIKNILATKQQDAGSARKKAVELIEKGISNAKVFVDNKEVEIGKSNPKERIKEGLLLLVTNVYNKAEYITKDYESESEVLRVLRSDDLEKYGIKDSETNKFALNDLFEYIKIRYERSGRVIFKDVKEHFMKKPYGWKEMTISGLVAVLYMREEIKLRSQTQYLVNDPEAAAKHLTRKDEADKLVIEIREKTGEEDLKAVRLLLREKFEKVNIPEKEVELYNTARETFSGELSELREIAGKYEEEKRYPGKKEVEAYSLFIKDLLDLSDPSSFFKAVAASKSEFETLHTNAEPVRAFFTGAQVKIFRQVAKQYPIFNRNIQFLDADAKASLEEINTILSLEKPYTRIKELTPLEREVEATIKESLSTQKQKVLRCLTGVCEELKRALSGEEFTPEFMESTLEPFKEVENFTEKAEDCALVESQLSRITYMREEAYRQIDDRSRILKEKQAKAEYGATGHGAEPGYGAWMGTEPGYGNGFENGYGIGAGPENAFVSGIPGTDMPAEALANPGNLGKATPLVRPSVELTLSFKRETEFISNISFFKSEKLLENSADIDEYIEKLRDKLMKILEEKNIRV